MVAMELGMGYGMMAVGAGGVGGMGIALVAPIALVVGWVWARKEQPSPSFVPDRAYFEAHVRSFTPNDLPTLYSKFPTGRQTSKYSNFLKRMGVTKLHAHPKVQATAASTAVGSQPIYHKPFSWEQFGFPGYS